jgi:ribosomal protein S27E
MSQEIIFTIDSTYYDVESKKPKGNNFYYKCEECNVIMPSNPSGPTECTCGNIVLDPEMFKMSVNNYGKFKVLELHT